MPTLPNPRQERFAQELAKGKTADEAYELAGYRQNRGNASTLKANQIILDRVAEILGRAAVRAEITVARFTEDLVRIADKAEALKGAPGLAVAKGAIMDAAKLNGLVIDRREVGEPGEFDGLTADELRTRLRGEAEAIGEGTIASSLVGGSGAARGKPH